jgi:hypothetical protein
MGSPESARRAQRLVEAVLRRSTATSLSNVDGFHDGCTTIWATLRVSPWVGWLSLFAPMTSWRLAGVVPPSTQCAAVRTQFEEMSVPPQKCEPPEVCTDVNHG